MKTQRNNVPLWMITNGWREVLARIFEEFEPQYNVTPEWLINPATKRRLKLDIFYPEIGVAVRFEGLQGKGPRRRLSLEEEDQLRARHNARVEACRQHHIQLVVIQLASNEINKIFQTIDTAISRALQEIEHKPLFRKLKEARSTAAALARKITLPKDLKLYAELWQDREYQAMEPAQSPVTRKITYIEGMVVEHPKFGAGIVLTTEPSDDDTLVTVDFEEAGQKTLAASLVGDKLLPQ